MTVDEYAQRYVTVCCCGGAGFIRADVPVGHPLFGKAIPCICRRDGIAKERGERLRRQCGIRDSEWLRWSLETFNPEACQPPSCRQGMRQIVAWIRDYAKEPRGWIVLTGGYGAGKTHLAYGIAQAALKAGRSVFAHTAPDILALLRETYNQGNFDEAFRSMCDVGLLVVDDLGAQRDTEWSQEQLYRLINHRYTLGAPLVVTMNVKMDALDPRVASRLQEGSKVGAGLTRIINLPCTDYRPIKTWKGGV